jgi:hypothetical protein
MNNIKSMARIAGILYIIGTVSGIMSVICTQSFTASKDPLSAIAGHESQLTLGAIFVLIMGLALALVPVVLFPVLKKQNEVLAQGYVVMRGALETVTYMAIVLGWLFLPVISKAYLAAGVEGSFDYTGLGKVLLACNEINFVRSIVFSLGAFMFYYLLYRSKLVPRFLSIWGFVALAFCVTGALLGVFGVIPTLSDTRTLMDMPLALQEMVLAVWFIVKGFNAKAVTALSNPIS